MKKILLLNILFIGFVIPSLAQYPNSDMIMKAMKDELNRSIKELKLDNLPAPYYIEYKIKVSGIYNSTASLGYIIKSNKNFDYKLDVGIRIGNYQLDNTNFIDFASSFFGFSDDEETFRSRNIPKGFDYNELRRQIWLATDAAYKQATEAYSKKLSILKNITRQDTVADFSKVEPNRSYDTIPFQDIDFDSYINRIRSLSAIFTNYPQIYTSQVNFEYLPSRIYYVNSEGMEYIKDEYFTGIEAICFTQTYKGIPLAQHYTAYSRFPKNLPSDDSLKKSLTDIATKLLTQISQPSLEESYNGPVIFEDQAAGELISRVFAPNLIARKNRVSEGSFFAGSRFTAFQKKIGGRVLPEFISVYDNPEDTYYKKTELIGTYKIDDQGLLARNSPVVLNGYLKTLLNDRRPIQRVLESNARQRGGVPTFSNLYFFVDPMKTMSETSLKEELLKLVKQRELPYGIIVKKIYNQNILSTVLNSRSYGLFSYLYDQNAIPVMEAYKIYPDGKEELIKNIQINSLTHQSFKDILYGGKSMYVHNILAENTYGSFFSEGSSWIPASIITPSLLFEDAEIVPIEKDIPKPPLLSNPISK